MIQRHIRTDPDLAEQLVVGQRRAVAVAAGAARAGARHPSRRAQPRPEGRARVSRVTLAVPATVSCASVERLPERVELAAYFVACEALANVAKYARATNASVRVASRNGVVVIEIADDGVGGADESAGTGLQGLADRVARSTGRCGSSALPVRAP